MLRSDYSGSVRVESNLNRDTDCSSNIGIMGRKGQNMDIKLYTTTIIWVDTFGELCEHHTRVFTGYEQALQHVSDVECEWLQMLRDNSLEQDLCLDLEIVKEHCLDEYFYRHYVYEDGKEKVFSIEKHVVNIESLKK